MDKNKYIKIYYCTLGELICAFDLKVKLITKFKSKLEIQMKRKIKSKRKKGKYKRKGERNITGPSRAFQPMSLPSAAWPNQNPAPTGGTRVSVRLCSAG